MVFEKERGVQGGPPRFGLKPRWRELSSNKGGRLEEQVVGTNAEEKAGLPPSPLGTHFKRQEEG